MIDVKNPEHREALKWAAETKAQAPSVVGYWSVGDDLAGGLRQEAIRALSSPEQSAAIVRALLEGLGCDAAVSHDAIYQEQADGAWHEEWWLEAYEGPEGVRLIGEVEADKAPALILALLDRTDAAGALAALREAGR